MRVKLSYTVEGDDVLREAAKLLNLSSDDVKQCIDLFNEIQTELRGGEASQGTPNVPVALEMIEEFRTALLNIDTRLAEVHSIAQAFETHRLSNFETAEVEGEPE